MLLNYSQEAKAATVVNSGKHKNELSFLFFRPMLIELKWPNNTVIDMFLFDMIHG